MATVEEFIRQSGVRSIDELNLVDECERQWWPECEGLDPKKVRASAACARPSFGLSRCATELLTCHGVLLAGSGAQAPRGHQGQGQH